MRSYGLKASFLAAWMLVLCASASAADSAEPQIEPAGGSGPQQVETLAAPQEAGSEAAQASAEPAAAEDVSAAADARSASSPAEQAKTQQPQMSPPHREVHYDFYFIAGPKGLSEEAMLAYVDELNQELRFQFDKVQAAQGVQIFLHPMTRIVKDTDGLTLEKLDVKRGENAVIVMAQGDAGRAAVKVMSEAGFEPLAYFLLDVNKPAEFRYGDGTVLVASYAGDKSGEVQLLPDPDSKYRNIIFHNHPEIDLAGNPNVKFVIRGNQYTSIVQLAHQKEKPVKVPPPA